MPFHLFTAFLMSEINPRLPENEGMGDKDMSGWPEGQGDAEFEKQTDSGVVLYQWSWKPGNLVQSMQHQEK